MPFFAYTTVFLLIPTLVVLVGAFLGTDNGFTLANVDGLTSPAVLRALRNSVVLSAVTAFAGAVIGADGITTSSPRVPQGRRGNARWSGRTPPCPVRASPSGR